jgi:glutathione synthase
MRCGTSGSETLSSGKATGQLVARAHAAEFDKNDTLASFMERIKERDAERIVMDDLDAVFLRNDSIEDLQERPWAIPRVWSSARCSRLEK